MQTYLYYENGRLTMPVQKVEVVRELPGKRWQVRRVGEEKEFVVREDLLLPRPLRGSAAESIEDEEESPRPRPFGAGAGPSYIYYKLAKFEPPYTRVQLQEHNAQNDTYTVLDLKTGQVIQGVRSSMLMPRPFLALVEDKGKEKPKEGKETSLPKASKLKSKDSAPPPEAEAAEAAKEAEKKLKQVEKNMENSAIVVLARFVDGDQQPLWYGEVREINPPNSLTIEFVTGEPITIDFRPSAIEIAALNRERHVEFETSDLTLEKIDELMRTRADDYPDDYPSIIEHFFDLLLQDAERKAYESLFERLIRPDRRIILEQRRAIQENMLDRWFDQQKYVVVNPVNIWQSCAYTLAVNEDILSDTDLYEKFKTDYVEKNYKQEPNRFDMRYCFEYIQWLSKRRTTFSKTYFKNKDLSVWIFYAIHLFNEMYGQNGDQYKIDVANWQVDEEGEEVNEDDEETDLTDSVYSLPELLEWKEKVMKSQQVAKKGQADTQIDGYLSELIDAYKEVVRRVGEMDGFEIQIDKKRDELSNTVGYKLFNLSSYRNVLKVISELNDKLRPDSRVDTRKIEQLFVEYN